MNNQVRHAGTILLLALCCGLAGCGGTKMLKESRPVVLPAPLTEAEDHQLAAALSWVIVREGPGTWARNADWDEYLLQVVNTSGEPLQITEVVVYDSLDTRLTSSGNRKALVKGSRDTARRYKGEGVKVKAGLGGPALLLAGGATYVAGMGIVGVAALATTTGGAGGVVAAAVIPAFLAPALAVGGVARSVNNGRVGREIESRQAVMPVALAAEEVRDLHVFFPLAPSPRRVELTYVDAAGEHVLTIDTAETLKGLHVVADDSGAEDGADSAESAK